MAGKRKKSISNEFIVSPIRIKRNKLHMKLSLNFKKKLTQVGLYPTMTLSDNLANKHFPMSKNLIGRNIMKKRGKKIIVRFYNYNYNIFKKFGMKNYSKIEKMSNCVFQIFAVKEELTQCYFSMGTVVKLVYGGKIKLVLITHWDNFNLISENINKFHFYGTNNKNNHFLNFFEGLSKFDTNDQKQEFFSLGHRFGLINLEINKLFLNCCQNFIKDANVLLFEVPHSIYELIDIKCMPSFNLNKTENLNLTKNICYYSLPLNYKFEEQVGNKEDVLPLQVTNLTNFAKSNTNEIKDLLIENHLKFDKLTLNFGQVDNINNYNDYTTGSTFKGSVEFGSVGSLLFQADKHMKPIGLNSGMVNGRNSFISLMSPDMQCLFKKFLLLSLENYVVNN